MREAIVPLIQHRVNAAIEASLDDQRQGVRSHFYEGAAMRDLNRKALLAALETPAEQLE